MNIPKIFVFLGRSGCGKGTQADLLMNFLLKKDSDSKTLHIESGSLLREFAKGDGYTNQLVKSAIESGTLVPEATIVALWTDYLTQNFTGVENIVFDGCPRKLQEAYLLGSILKFYNLIKPNVFFMDVSREWAHDRLVGRGRKDDSPESIKKRLDWFETEVLPSINFFKNDPFYNFIVINGEQTIPAVHDEILTKLQLK
jgi:adenylate kinase